MKLRRYESKDCETLIKLFQDTVHTVNGKDYTEEQLNVWATGREDLIKWDRSFRDAVTVIAEEDGTIVGFGDMDRQGYLDHLYVHRNHLRKGIGAKIVEELEKEVGFHNIAAFTTFASITARPFFEKLGYKVMYQNTVARGDVELVNYFMKKEKPKL